MSAHSIHYHVLKQVWTNHVLPFLCPNLFHWRKQMPIVLHEMNVVMYACSHNRIVCSPCRRQYRHRSFWLTSHLGVSRLTIDTDNRRVNKRRYWYLIFHVWDDGVPHCSTFLEYINAHLNHWSFTRRHTCVDLRFDVPMYYDIGTWEDMHQPYKESECVCLNRALVLHSIRNR
jgi:hypothetical protein